jgi:uncharacterized protein
MPARTAWRRRIARWISIYVLLSLIGGIALAELQLHLQRRPLHHRDEVAVAVRSQFRGTLEDVQIQAQDGAILRAWYIRPENDNGRDVLMLHGITDNREGVAGFAPMVLQQGYRVLLPDSRAHGESGGTLATYGLVERDDIHRWVDWLYDDRHSACVYGFGESMGAALVLQSLAVERRFCAVVADSAFSSFRAVAYDRVGYYVHLGRWFGQTAGRLPVEIGLLYAKWRYGLALRDANPEKALGGSDTPVLLIHGRADVNIRPWHSERMAAEFPTHVQLWEVSGGQPRRSSYSTTRDVSDKTGRLVQRAFSAEPAIASAGWISSISTQSVGYFPV